MPPWLDEVYEQYWQLDTERVNGESIGRIPWRLREEKLDKLRISDPWERAERLYLWGELESEHFRIHAERIEALRNSK